MGQISIHSQLIPIVWCCPNRHTSIYEPSDWPRCAFDSSQTDMVGVRLEQMSLRHYNDIIMGAIGSQITSLTIIYSIVYSDADQRKRQSSASLAFVRGIHRGPVNSPHKWPVTRKMFPFDDVIMVFWHFGSFLFQSGSMDITKRISGLGSNRWCRCLLWISSPRPSPLLNEIEVFVRVVYCGFPTKSIIFNYFFFTLWNLSQIGATEDFTFQMCNNILQKKIIFRHRKQFCTLMVLAKGLPVKQRIFCGATTTFIEHFSGGHLVLPGTVVPWKFWCFKIDERA